ncbi:hypothetical protein CYMTET_33593 [Cymbomonas tetramitiformis]|uniref:Uncharacterized protein n=1 Tax=Cymbomonas tetramitiformis TaxID=36881 RepID=A0AAE0FDD5_9CHLO|nr:hypothetical protein CYMTET_33593 [Cymbomonas tetramitiformis]
MSFAPKLSRPRAPISEQWYVRKVESTQAQKEKLDEKYHDMRKEVRSLSTTVEGLDRALEESQRSARNYEHESAESMVKLRQANHENFELHERALIADGKLQEAETKVHNMKRLLGKTEADRLSTQAAHEAHCTGLAQSVEACSSELKEVSEERRQLAERCEMLEARLRQLNDQNFSLQNKHNTLAEDHHRALAKVAELEKLLENVDESFVHSRHRLETEKIQLMERVTLLEDRLRNAEVGRDATESARQQLFNKMELVCSWHSLFACPLITPATCTCNPLISTSPYR